MKFILIVPLIALAISLTFAAPDKVVCEGVSECVEGEVISCKRVGPFRKIKTCVVQDGKYCESESTKKTREPCPEKGKSGRASGRQLGKPPGRW